MKFNNRNIYLGPNIQLGKNVRIGDDTIIYGNVKISDNTTICNNCIIGEPLNEYYINQNYENPITKIGANSLIRSHTIIYASVKTGTHFQTGHRVIIREESIFGDYCRVGTQSDIQGFVEFGNYCRLHSSVHICQHSIIGNYVFIYPFVVFTNDPHPPSKERKGPEIGDYTQIAVSSVIGPHIKIGHNCLIAANSFVNEDVPHYAIYGGNPAKYLQDIRDFQSKITGVKYYPWKDNFKIEDED